MTTLIKPVLVMLDCHHKVDTVPQERWTEPVRCWVCSSSRHVVAVWEFCRVKCVTCKEYKGTHGWHAYRTAERATYKHSRENPSHIVQCYRGGERVITTTLARTQPELPLFALPPPF